MKQSLKNITEHCLLVLKKIPITFFAVALSILTSIYLIDDYGVVNHYFIDITYGFIDSTNSDSSYYFKQLLVLFAKITGLDIELSSRILMILTHATITLFLVLIGIKLDLSKITLWSLLFLLLSQSNYNNFRTYIIAEPIYWSLLLCSLYVLIAYYKQNVVLVVIIWCFNFLLAGFFSLAAWFWLAFFPFGALFWHKWRTKPVYYALLGYAVFVCIILAIPFFSNHSIFALLTKIVTSSYNELQQNIQTQRFNWLGEDSDSLIIIYILSGGLSLVVVKTMLSMGIINVILLFIAFYKKQIQIISQGKLRFIIYITVFSLICALMTSLFHINNQSVDYFSIVFILLIFSAIGLSYIFQKAYLGRYQKVTVLLIVWCMVAYIASGFISFGPSKTYIKNAGLNNIKTANMYSDNKLFLYYAKNLKSNYISLDKLDKLVSDNPTKTIYFGFELSRKKKLPANLQDKTIVDTFTNEHQDRFIIFSLNNDKKQLEKTNQKPNQNLLN